MPYPLYLFAKSPIAGKVKTRMQPELNEVQSAQLAEQLLRDCTNACLSHWPGEVILSVTPDTTHPVFNQFDKKINLELQVAGNLGDRLYHGLQKGIQQSGGSVVMGCDIPHIDKQTLQQVWDAINAGKNIIGAAADGGFYILGMSTYHPSMFDDIVWGTNQVFKKVLDNFSRLNIAVEFCKTLKDIDNWHDLQWLAREYSGYRHYLDNH